MIIAVQRDAPSFLFPLMGLLPEVYILSFYHYLGVCDSRDDPDKWLYPVLVKQGFHLKPLLSVHIGAGIVKPDDVSYHKCSFALTIRQKGFRSCLSYSMNRSVFLKSFMYSLRLIWPVNSNFSSAQSGITYDALIGLFISSR